MDQKRRYLFLWMLIAGGVFIIISGLALAILNRLTNKSEVTIPTTAGEVSRVTVADAKTAFDEGAAVFVDVRDPVAYEEAHIPGALFIPLNELSDHLDELDSSRWVITYCT